MTTDELRSKFQKFYEERGHVVIPSGPLIPENDPTTLFTGSGMQPLLPFLLGETHPEGNKLVNAQKSFRAVDIAEVGDNRHTTFFEMLGNWSLGDYFKSEQIPWVFAFLTDEVGLDPKRLYVTCFAGNNDIGISKDTESAEIWAELFTSKGIESEIHDFSKTETYGRITYYDEQKNWWSRSGVPEKMPEGEPGGPDSELFWDFGSELKLHENSQWASEPCHPNCDCGRFIEIGNSVFMEFQKQGGAFIELTQKNVDFGGGLERILMACNDDPDIFRTHAFAGAITAIETRANIKYGEDEDTTRLSRIALDHIRAAVMLIADNVLPSNKDQGYFVRRLLRRAVYAGDKLGATTQFTEEIAQTFIDVYKNHYTAVGERSEEICSVIRDEEQKFRKTLTAGKREFEKRFSATGKISGEDAFILYSTYGFPRELTEELANERGQNIDHDEFQKEFASHQERSRSGAKEKFAGGLADHSAQSVKYHTATHLLHQALRTVLGDHVEQRGSNITPERMRFDFTHPKKLTDEEKQQVEDIVNTQIERNLPVSWEEMSTSDAKKSGALGVFEDKYANTVKVYSVGDFSKEICGGPHVERTGEIGKFKITKEEASSAGVRRIRAIVE